MRLEDLKPYYLMELKERIEERYTVTNTGCWEWTAGLTTGGYGKMSVKQKTKVAHRVYYQLIKGFLPDDMVLDHIVCNNPPCINPDHLKPVTNWENTLRSNNVVARNFRATECIHGHKFTKENTIHYLSRGKPARACRECRLGYLSRRGLQRTKQYRAQGLNSKGKPLPDNWKRKYGLL